MRFVLALVILVSACGKGDHKKCDLGCRNYATLAFWAEWDPQINTQPEAERAQLRHLKLVELNYRLEQGLPHCIQSCELSNNQDQYECMVAAKTFDQAKECAETEAAANE